MPGCAYIAVAWRGIAAGPKQKMPLLATATVQSDDLAAGNEAFAAPQFHP